MDPTQLRDIHAVLGNPWWPPAPGWWLLLATLLGLGFIAWSLRGSWRLRVPIPFITLGDWRWDAGRELRRLRRPFPGMSLKTRVGEVSELLRRVAMARHGRDACAGLSGPAWLDWLSAHDPHGFDWVTHGALLIRATYAPEPPHGTGGAEINRMLDALEAWIAVRPPRPAGRGLRGRLVRLLPAQLRSRLRAAPVPATPAAPDQPRDPAPTATNQSRSQPATP